MASLEELQDALKNADAAGDTEAARKLADAIVSARGSEKPKSDFLAGTLQSVNQGLGFSFADEAVAGIGTALGRNPQSGEYFDYSRGLGESYSQNLAAERGHLRQFRQEHPIASMGAEVAGSAPYAFMAAANPAVIRSGAQMVSRSAPAASRASAPTLGGNVLRGGSTAGLYGGAYGLGQGEGGFSPRLESARKTALIGALLGGGIPAATHAGGATYSAASNRLMASLGSKEAGANIATRKMAQALMRDKKPGMSQQAAFRRAQRRAQVMGPEAGLMDTGENARALSGAVSRMPGEGKTRITQRVLDRQEGVSGPMRVREGGQAQRVDRMLEGIEDNRLRATTDRLYQERSAAGREAFDKALDTGPIYSDRLQQFIDDPITSSGFQRGLELQRLDALRQGKPFNPSQYGVTGFDEAGAPVLGEVPTMRTYQAMKEGLDEIVNESVDKFGRLTKRGVAVKGIRDELVKELDTFNPAYAEARKVWAGPTQQLNAARSGYRFMSKAEFRNEDDVAAMLKNMSEPERESFRVGVVQALRDKAGEKVARGDITKDLMGKEGLEKKLRLAFGDAKTFKRYKRMLEGEAEQFETYLEVTKGSQTQPRKQADADLAEDPGAGLAMAEGILQNPFSIPQWGRSLSRGAAAAARRASRPPESARRELAEMLLGRDTRPLSRRMDQIDVSEEQRRRLARALLGTELAIQ